jgi:sugar phosphate isomerase/epimerase
MTTAIVGYSGFVGSNLLKFYKFDYFYNSSNFHEAMNKEFDTLFFSGIPAVKWIANKYPEEDSNIINKIKTIIETIKVKKIILISTIDVYESINSQENEDYDCDYENNHTYGKNRYLFENFIKEKFDNYYIIRLPALFGMGLKKNIIYDLVNNNQVDKIEKNTKFQWYDLKWLKNDIDIILSNELRVSNLFTEPLETIEILKLFNYSLNEYKNESTLYYDVKTKYSDVFNSNCKDYIRDKNIVLNNIKEYLDFSRIDKSNLVVSNICINHISQFQFSNIIKLFGIKNIQIAPTTLIKSWNDFNNINFDLFTKNDINVYSFQSITFGLNDNIFDVNSTDNLSNHIKKVIDCAIKNKVKVLVFGCPKNRKIIDDKKDQNDEIFISFFKKIGDYIEDNDLHICIENNSKSYGCNYLNSIKEVGEIVNKINHKKIKMMIDIGNVIMEDDNLDYLNDYKELLYNVDIANESMKPFIQDKSEIHNNFITILKQNNYNKKINLEMLLKANGPCEELELLNKSLHNFINLLN